MDKVFPPITNLPNTPELDSVRYSGDCSLITKAGILPYHRGEDGELSFLIAKPKPVRNPNDSVPFAMARGTRRVENKNGELVDIRNAEVIEYAKAYPEKVEPTWQTVLAEAYEELGLEANNITRLYDIGVLNYKDYGIHFYTAEVNDPSGLISAIDSEEVCWANQSDINNMVKTGKFNCRYHNILSCILSAIKTSDYI